MLHVLKLNTKSHVFYIIFSLISYCVMLLLCYYLIHISTTLDLEFLCIVMHFQIDKGNLHLTESIGIVIFGICINLVSHVTCSNLVL